VVDALTALMTIGQGARSQDPHDPLAEHRLSEIHAPFTRIAVAVQMWFVASSLSPWEAIGHPKGERMTAVAAIRSVSRLARRLPIGSQIGLVVMVLGLAADLLAHLDPSPRS
jgi:hypothetical protein